MSDPNWAEQVTAIATALGAVGLLSTLTAATFAPRKDARHDWPPRRKLPSTSCAAGTRPTSSTPAGSSRGTEHRTNDPDAFRDLIATNSVDAGVLCRELDFIEQLGAREALGTVHLDLVCLLLGTRLVDRWELWKPSIDMMGTNAYPMFKALVTMMRREVIR